MKKFEHWTRADLEAEVHALHTRMESKIEAAVRRRTKARAEVYNAAIEKLKELIAKNKQLEVDKLADEAVSTVARLEAQLDDKNIILGNSRYFYDMARAAFGLPVTLLYISDRTAKWQIEYHLKYLKEELAKAGVNLNTHKKGKGNA